MVQFFRKFRKGQRANKVLGVDNLNRIADTLANMEGNGVQIVKPTNADGKGWRIVFDGVQSDQAPLTTPPVEVRYPFDLFTVGADKTLASDGGQARVETDESDVSISARKNALTSLCFQHGGAIGTTLGFGNNHGPDGPLYLPMQNESGGDIFRLAHGNQHTGWVREVDGKSIQLDADYDAGCGWTLEKWNVGATEVASQETIDGYDFMVFDTYIPDDVTDEEAYLDANPHEIKWLHAGEDWLRDTTYTLSCYIDEYVKASLCPFVLEKYNVAEWQQYCGDTRVEYPPYDEGTNALMYGNAGNWYLISSLADLPQKELFDAERAKADALKADAEADRTTFAGEQSTSTQQHSTVWGNDSTAESYGGDQTDLEATVTEAETELNTIAAMLGQAEATIAAYRARVDALMSE